jgi:membrane associated rhomboid family serine protease
MFPLYDQYKIPGKKPYITLGLILMNTILFFWSLPHLEFFIFKYGLIPARIFQGKALFTLFSSMFFHAGIGHLLGNMWFLWVFGDNLERRLGKVKFLAFYILAGLFSALIYLLLAPEKSIPAIGASGAISGVLGGYLILFPRHRIVSLVPIFFFIELIAIPAVIFIGIWFLYQLFYIGSQTMVAYWAHIGGFVAGIFLIRFFVKPQEFYYEPF